MQSVTCTDSDPLHTVDHGRARLVSLSDPLYSLSMLTRTPSSLLPNPIHAPVVSDDEDDVVSQVQPQQQAGPSQAVVIRQAVPPYGQRRGWKPTSLEDFGAQYRHSSHRPCLTFPQATVERIPNAMLLNTL